ncbi:TetR/AcrR family transcriptional regulator [Dactylosporangium sp. McL0621]|uniref:TetR/AcrR family transcriptional regulator n=1 Tax=Dactylosporangium sp. McL0621 TaxID=3415678 RepID=UPI003CE9C7D5
MGGTTGAEPVRQQRADARRNVAAILDAAVLCLTEHPDASLADIAQAAGVGRVTLYGHFKSRAELLDAVLIRTMAEADAVLDAVDTAGEPAAALTRLVEASWQIVHRFRSVYRAAGRELPPERFHDSHDRVRRRLQTIIERGRRAGVFRTDVTAKWLTAATVGLMHAAAEESAAGRLAPHDAPLFISAIVLAALTAPGAPVPAVRR